MWWKAAARQALATTVLLSTTISCMLPPDIPSQLAGGAGAVEAVRAAVAQYRSVATAMLADIAAECMSPNNFVQV